MIWAGDFGRLTFECSTWENLVVSVLSLPHHGAVLAIVSPLPSGELASGTVENSRMICLRHLSSSWMTSG